MRFHELKEKANCLPYSPGVYIMRDKENTVIYVGKAKKLKNRVSQYFQETASHTAKTRIMVSKIDHFEVIVAASEFEALVLECSLIKRYLPKYNILLKDDKGYPYVRVDLKQQFPQLSLANKVQNDGANYYGPFGSRGVTQHLLEIIRTTLKLPGCHKKFPQDIGKDRPCLNYHMNQCAGWCQAGKGGQVQYRKTIDQAVQLLQGNYKSAADDIRAQMLEAAESLNFELAASLRDQLHAVESLGQRQLVTAGSLADTDVIGFAQNETKACFTVLHFSGGNLLDKDYEILTGYEEAEYTVSALMKQYYLNRGFAPKFVLLPFSLEDGDLFEQLLEQEYNRKIHIKIPQRGDNVRLVELAQKNAVEELERITTKEEKNRGILSVLGKMLGIEPPRRVESYDISNISGTDIVASMVVFIDGKPAKSQYRRFQIKDLKDQNDYESMHQVIFRRFQSYLNGDKGFSERPDLLLIDGGAVHAETALIALRELNISIPTFGMVKDDRHRTRALVTAENEEIRIDNQQAIFAMVGNIQEETHRFAITYHRLLRSKRLHYSELDQISGIGPKRKQELLKVFKSISGIKNASLMELEQYLPQNAAAAVYKHFNQER